MGFLMQIISKGRHTPSYLFDRKLVNEDLLIARSAAANGNFTMSEDELQLLLGTTCDSYLLKMCNLMWRADQSGYNLADRSDSTLTHVRHDIRSSANMSNLSRFLHDESGATAIEYGLIAAGIGVVIITAVWSVGSSLSGLFDTVADTLDSV